MKNVRILLVVMMPYFLCCATDNEKVQVIAQEMHGFGRCCQNESLERMKELRLQFLNNNKSATVKQLIDAINTPVDGKDIISLLREADGDVCRQCADLIAQDKELGEGAIAIYLGWLTIGTAMATGQLS